MRKAWRAWRGGPDEARTLRGISGDRGIGPFLDHASGRLGGPGFPLRTRRSESASATRASSGTVSKSLRRMASASADRPRSEAGPGPELRRSAVPRSSAPTRRGGVRRPVGRRGVREPRSSARRARASPAWRSVPRAGGSAIDPPARWPKFGAPRGRWGPSPSETGHDRPGCFDRVPDLAESATARERCSATTFRVSPGSAERS